MNTISYHFNHLSRFFLLLFIIFNIFNISNGYILKNAKTVNRNILRNTKNSIDIDIIRDAILYRKVSKENVINSIANIEKNSINPKKKISSKAIEGKWELVFSSLIPSGYFPIIEICDFFEFSLTSSWGPIPLGFIIYLCF